MTIQELIKKEQERLDALQKREQERENALPWDQRTSWRKRPKYRGWTLEATVERVNARAVATRSRNGYRVLNTADLGMVDIDFNLEYDLRPQQQEALSNLRKWGALHPEQSWREYRTARGMRFLRTDAPQPLDGTYDAVCAAVGDHDDLYRKLCHEQHAFRMRISPKPQRCGIEMPSWNPYDDGDGWSSSDPDHTLVPLYTAAYETVAGSFKVCELVETVGSGVVHPDLQPVIAYHDEHCKVTTKLKMEPLHRMETDGPTSMDGLAFNKVFRADGFAHPLIWSVLSDDVRSGLKRLEVDTVREAVLEEHRRQRKLFRKWRGVAGRFAHLIEATKNSLMDVGQRIAHYEALDAGDEWEADETPREPPTDPDDVTPRNPFDDEPDDNATKLRTPAEDTA